MSCAAPIATLQQDMTYLNVRYWYKHRPALERGRIDLQIAVFGELQRQMNQLSQRSENQTKS